MKELSELDLPEKCLYTKDHEWITSTNGAMRIGINDYAQDQLGEIVFVELPEKGTVLNKSDEFGTVESVKAVSELYMPVSGEVLQVNSELEDAPELVNNDPYEKGWMMEVKAADPDELKALMDKETYLKFLEGIE